MDDAPLRLPKPLEVFVEEQVRSGAYADRSAVINDAVERLALDLVRFGTLGFQAPYRIVSSPTLIGA